SLVGGAVGDEVGQSDNGTIGVTALTKGNYVVDSPFWGGSGSDGGAVTWGSGTAGTDGPVSAATSLGGTGADDPGGGGGVTALAKGNYVVNSPSWGHGSNDLYNGAVTWGNGATGATGPVSTANSLVGRLNASAANQDTVTALANGNYVVASP